MCVLPYDLLTVTRYVQFFAGDISGRVDTGNYETGFLGIFFLASVNGQITQRFLFLTLRLE